MRIGFACLWDHADPRATWSGTPWALREALRRQVDLVDLGVRPSAALATALRLTHLRWRAGRPTSTWDQSRITDAYCRVRLSKAVATSGCDAVLQIQDLAVLDRPYFLYQDLSFDALLDLHRRRGGLPQGLAVARLSPSHLARRRDRQQVVYRNAAGVITMSRWLARHLVEVTGLPAERVHVVHPGRNGAVPAGPPPERPAPRRRLLLVGRGLPGKGGDLVVAALAVLRRRYDPDITLTVAGPRRWPLPGGVPDGVRFLGPVPPAEVAGLYDRHDLLVMPSRLEGFGMVFVEALSRGLPCIGRDAFAMPEIIEPGVTGALIRDDDPVALAETVAAVLADDAVYEACRRRAAAVAAYYTWERAAAEIAAIVSGRPRPAVTPPVGVPAGVRPRSDAPPRPDPAAPPLRPA